MKKVVMLALLLLVIFHGCSDNQTPKLGKYYVEGFALLPMPVYVHGVIGNDQYGSRMGPIFDCWIWGRYWYDSVMRSGYVFSGDEFGTNVTNGKCEGVTNP